MAHLTDLCWGDFSNSEIRGKDDLYPFNALVKYCLKPTQESSDSLEKVIFIVLSITIN